MPPPSPNSIGQSTRISGAVKDTMLAVDLDRAQRAGRLRPRWPHLELVAHAPQSLGDTRINARLEER
jgi:hypothetical protein